jgi:hypothetical protein
MAERRKSYTIRPSYMYQAKHFNDVFLNLGYKYKGKILKNGTSPELWANPLQIPMLNTLEGILNFLVEQAKYVKKWCSIAHNRDTTNIT